MTKKLTPKQTKFVKGVASGKSQRESYVEAYETKGSIDSIDVQASQLAAKPKIQEALQDLFGLEETKQVVKNVHKLAISADDQKVQLEASKEWLTRSMGNVKDSGNTINNFGVIVSEQKDRYAE
jgi:phage terminase small subunit